MAMPSMLTTPKLLLILVEQCQGSLKIKVEVSIYYLFYCIYVIVFFFIYLFYLFLRDVTCRFL